jgi:DNA-binding transcriptional ArsR family regulator
MRALAHPVRLRILFELRSAPATATLLSTKVGASPSVASWHLRHLAGHGLIAEAPELGRGRERWWRAVGTGCRYAVTDEDSRLAANTLQSALSDVQGDVVTEWRRETEPRLEPAWRAVAGTADTTVSVTVEELAEVNAALEQILAPYVARHTPPSSARPVRIQHHVMPSADLVDRTSGCDNN